MAFCCMLHKTVPQAHEGASHVRLDREMVLNEAAWRGLGPVPVPATSLPHKRRSFSLTPTPYEDCKVPRAGNVT